MRETERCHRTKCAPRVIVGSFSFFFIISKKKEKWLKMKKKKWLLPRVRGFRSHHFLFCFSFSPTSFFFFIYFCLCRNLYLVSIELDYSFGLVCASKAAVFFFFKRGRDNWKQNAVHSVSFLKFQFQLFCLFSTCFSLKATGIWCIDSKVIIKTCTHALHIDMDKPIFFQSEFLFFLFWGFSSLLTMCWSSSKYSLLLPPINIIDDGQMVLIFLFSISGYVLCFFFLPYVQRSDEEL